SSPGAPGRAGCARGEPETGSMPGWLPTTRFCPAFVLLLPTPYDPAQEFDGGMQSTSPRVQSTDAAIARHTASRAQRNLCAVPALIIFDRGWSCKVGRSEMSMPDNSNA